MMATWRLVACFKGHLPLEDHLVFWKRALSPRWNGHTWITCMQACIGLDHVGVLDPKVYIALQEHWSLGALGVVLDLA